MRHLLAASAAFIALLLLGSVAPAQEQPHLVIISVDGLMPSSYTTDGPAKIPTLRQMVREGAYAEGVIGVLPTITRPSHTTLITGVPPAIHGIYDNQIVDPEGRLRGTGYWYAPDIRVPTLPGAARGRGLRVASVMWPVSVGLSADFLVPRPFHPTERLKVLRALSTPHLLDAVEAALGRPLRGPRLRLDIAKFIIRTYQPHVTLLQLGPLDGAQHRFGPGSPEALETLERMDGYLGEIREVLEETGLGDRTYFAVVSDHGFSPVEQQLHVNALFKQEGLLRTDEAGTIVDWQAYFHRSGGSGFVFLKDSSDTALRDRVHALLRTLSADPANGIRELWTREDLARFGARPDAEFGVDMRRGFITGSGHETLITPATVKGQHGFAPTRPEMHASLVVTGPGLNGRGNVGIVRMTQIAPTFAKLLGIGLSPEVDEPIEALLPGD